jgi:hypothetical protein
MGGADSVGCDAAKEAVRAVLKDVIAKSPALSEVRGTALYVRLFGEHAANEQIVELMDIVDSE